MTTQSVECEPGNGGHALVRSFANPGAYSIYQQGTYAPGDGVHRWMGSVAMDKNGALGGRLQRRQRQRPCPGIRYTGRVAGDPLGTMRKAKAW